MRQVHILLNLEFGQAPKNGLTIALASSNRAVAAVPQTVTIPAGASSVFVQITSVGDGTATITASDPSVPTMVPGMVTINVSQ
jgi:hypothetical protein